MNAENLHKARTQTKSAGKVSQLAQASRLCSQTKSINIYNNPKQLPFQIKKLLLILSNDTINETALRY